MNHRERMEAVLSGRPPDRIPWVPRLQLWYEAHRRTGTLPPQYEGLTLREIERDLGLGTPARDGRIMEERLEGVEITSNREGPFETVTYHTPVGSVETVTRHSVDLDRLGLPGRIASYPLKTPRDYAVWRWIVSHMDWSPTYEAYRTYDAEIGQDGLPMVSVGDVPFHEWLEKLAGYEYGFYHLADFPQEVESLLSLMAEVQRERLWPVIAESPARFVLHGAHLSSQFTPPHLFRKYILPYYEGLMPLLHERGIRVAMHADNDTSLILDLIREAGWDVVECFVTAPMVPLTLEHARSVWGNEIIIWGGLPSTLLSPSTPEEAFRDYVNHLWDVIAPGDAFILGVADNVMPDSLIERVRWVSEQVEERGWYPITRQGVHR